MTLNVNNVTKKFGDKIAVNNISFTLGKGSMLGFLGGNGAGKTTTFRMLLGLTNVTHGTIT
ncbi:ATP-binding cassette domain-containing protein, partial [Staphylococcus epidermidis]